jgi:3-hydroxyisobutyrate dehydrogenase-like beta-hydroxyacid dehydrogenase
MGAAMGRHLLDAGTILGVYDVAPDACVQLVERGAAACESPADVAAGADVTLVVVVDDAQTREAVESALAGAKPGSVIALCASIRPDTCTELAAAGRERNVRVVDAALVRGERGAEEGRLVLYCGGDADAIRVLEEACAPFTEAVLRVGAIGAGQVAKTANNILLWANIRADVEALRLGRALGVEPAVLREAMAVGSGANRPLAEWGRHRLRWPHKDLEVALAVANEAGVEMPLVERLAELMGELDVADLHELL